MFSHTALDATLVFAHADYDSVLCLLIRVLLHEFYLIITYH